MPAILDNVLIYTLVFASLLFLLKGYVTNRKHKKPTTCGGCGCGKKKPLGQ